MYRVGAVNVWGKWRKHMRLVKNQQVFFLTSVPYGGGQLHIPAALTPEEESLARTEQES
jgi:hypothetical protein